MSKRENNYSAKLIIAMLFMFLGASFSPIVSANSNENNEQNEEENNQINEPYVIGDLNDFMSAALAMEVSGKTRTQSQG